MLEELVGAGRRILVYSQFTRMLDLIQHELNARAIAHARLDGATRDRETPVARFQSGDLPVFLISLKAGGVGLNLTQADTVIHYDPWWNPAAENQAADRAHRIGQDKPIFVYRLICAGTVEERVRALQARKAALAKGVLEGGTSQSLVLEPADLEELLAPLA
jgi:non-specific serine/threonine protein kinase